MRPFWPAPDPTPVYAVPLTGPNVKSIMEALAEASHRYQGVTTTTTGSHTHVSFDSDSVDRYARRAGAAFAAGLNSVPLTFDELDLLRYTRHDLFRMKSRLADDFEALLTGLNFLTGVARVLGWTVHRADHGEWVWDAEPAIDRIPDYKPILPAR